MTGMITVLTRPLPQPALVGRQASTGKIYEPFEEEVVRTARSFM